MSKRLSFNDTRAVRMVLEEHEYATGGEEVPPTDLIDSEIWHGIMNLPDDVSIRISNHHGTKFRLLYQLWGDWFEAMGNEQDELYGPMLDAADCFKSSLFDFLHGYYRSAISNLRSALELVILGAYGCLHPNDRAFVNWQEGGPGIPFSACRKLLAKEREGRLFEQRGLIAEHYRRLCDHTHSRLTASDGYMWQSNGPVYNGDAIVHVMSMSLLTYAICYLLIRVGRPKFSVPTDSRIVFDLDNFPWCKEVLSAYKSLYPAVNGPQPPM